ncbi:hypothetical protein HK099_005624 [Clydaea vesicula]|uniref:Uncharacterized protein n=1 Tax=Clydaea vesicula TaxID=447962 RepID=A0AAD5XUT4_9FUNG|nr:hypothetical protein HK099_005624 [Clydaea vesicula]
MNETNRNSIDSENNPFPFSNEDFVGSSLNLAQSPPQTCIKVIDLLISYSSAEVDAAKRGIKSIGVDLDPRLIKECKELSKSLNLDHLTEFVLLDMFDFDLSNFTICSCYIYKKTLNDLHFKLNTRLALGGFTLATILYPFNKINPVFNDDIYKIFVYDQTSLVVNNQNKNKKNF